MIAALSNPRLLVERNQAGTILSPETSLLSMDVFGVALQQLVLDGHDLHHFVASELAGAHPWLAERYPRLRRRAESQARSQARRRSRPEIAMAEMADVLQELIAAEIPTDSDATPAEIRQAAISTEIDLLQALCRPNPDAIWLYDRAVERSIPVAFLADSHLPRDLIGRLLRRAGFRADHLLISSHEGVTKADGLFDRLVRSVTADPATMVHLGPDYDLDIEIPVELGMQASLYPTIASGESSPLVINPDHDRRGLDSIALALADWRLRGVDREAARPIDIGYYAGGPLAIGLATWVGHVVEAIDPDQVLICGPAAEPLCQVIGAVHDEGLVDRLVAFPPPDPHDCPAAHIVGLDEMMTADDEARLLIVDVGLPASSRHLPALTLRGIRPRAELVTASVAPAPGLHQPTRPDEWQLEVPGGPETADDPTLGRVLQALIGAGPEPEGGAPFDQVRGELAAGVELFVEDIQPWLAHSELGATSALLEPAVRILAEPTRVEAAVVGRYPATPDDGLPARCLVPQAASGRPGMVDPQTVEATADSAPWPAGYRALARSSVDRVAAPRRSRRSRRSRLRSFGTTSDRAS